MKTALAEKPQPEAEAPPQMRVTLNRGEFLHALSHAAAIVENRNTIPVLANVLLEAEGDSLKIVSTDLNLQAALTVPAKVDGDGSITVSAKLLHGIVREFDDGAQVELKVDGDRLHVNSGRSRYKLQTIGRDDFPVLVPGGALASFDLPAGAFRHAVRRVAAFQSVDDIVQPALCGIFVEVADTELTFVATDRNRIAWATMPAPEGADFTGLTMAPKFIQSLVKLSEDDEGAIRLTIEERKLIAEVGSAVLTGKLVEGEFLPWRRVIPGPTERSITVSAKALDDAVRRVALVAADKTRSIKVDLTTDKMTLSCRPPIAGDVATEETPCVWAGEDCSIGFNSRFLAAVFRCCGLGELQIDLAENSAVIRNLDDDTAKWLVGQVRV